MRVIVTLLFSHYVCSDEQGIRIPDDDDGGFKDEKPKYKPVFPTISNQFNYGGFSNPTSYGKPNPGPTSYSKPNPPPPRLDNYAKPSPPRPSPNDYSKPNPPVNNYQQPNQPNNNVYQTPQSPKPTNLIPIYLLSFKLKKWFEN